MTMSGRLLSAPSAVTVMYSTSVLVVEMSSIQQKVRIRIEVATTGFGP